MNSFVIWNMSSPDRPSFGALLAEAGNQDCEMGNIPSRFAGLAGILIIVLGLWAVNELGSVAIRRIQSIRTRPRRQQYKRPGDTDSVRQRGVTTVDIGYEAHRHSVKSRRTSLGVLTGVCGLILLIPPVALLIVAFLFGIIIMLLIVIRDNPGIYFGGPSTRSSPPVGAGPPLVPGSGVSAHATRFLFVFIPGMTLVGFGLMFSFIAGGRVVCNDTGKTSDLLFTIAGGASCIAAGLLLVWAARRTASQGSPELLAVDHRAPVLYLRSFSGDSMRIRTERWARRTWLDRLTGPERERFEQIVAWHLWSYGPVVAIKRPGGSRRLIGAAREELNPDNWTRQIDEWLVSARLISMTLGRTTGLQWEINRIRELGLRDKLLVVFPPIDEQELDSLWQEFQQCWQPEKGISPLPGGESRALAATLDEPGGATLIMGCRPDESNYRLAIETAAQLLEITPQAWDPVPINRKPRARVLPVPLTHPEIRGEVYYLAQSNKVVGPFGVMQLRRMAFERTITPATQVTTGNQHWEPMLPVMHIPGIYSRRSRRTALILAIFCGILGLDRFYLGKYGTGIAKLMTLAGLGGWWLLDIAGLGNRITTDVDGLPLR